MTLQVDVTVEAIVYRPIAEVAAFAADPDNARLWYDDFERVEWQTPRPVRVGSRITFVARFLGKRLK